jgi:hypothetical protein
MRSPKIASFLDQCYEYFCKDANLNKCHTSKPSKMEYLAYKVFQFYAFAPEIRERYAKDMLWAIHSVFKNKAFNAYIYTDAAKQDKYKYMLMLMSSFMRGLVTYGGTPDLDIHTCIFKLSCAEIPILIDLGYDIKFIVHEFYWIENKEEQNDNANEWYLYQHGKYSGVYYFMDDLLEWSGYRAHPAGISDNNF